MALTPAEEEWVRETKAREAVVNKGVRDELAAIRAGVDRLEVRLTAQNGRIGKLETWRATFVGALGVILALLGAGILRFGPAILGGE